MSLEIKVRKAHPPAERSARNASARPGGFTLVELVVTVAIIGILAAIAYPSYVNSITKSRRASAGACLASYTTQMERFYTTNLRYDENLDSDTMDTDALVALGMDCASDQNTGQFYSYSFAANQPTRTTYTLLATPKGSQATRDTGCGELSITNTGVRSVAGSNGVAKCW